MTLPPLRRRPPDRTRFTLQPPILRLNQRLRSLLTPRRRLLQPLIKPFQHRLIAQHKLPQRLYHAQSLVPEILNRLRYNVFL